MIRSLIALLVASLAACTLPQSDSRSTPQALPDANAFPPVAQLLDVRCGSLDCHGTVARNLRLYGSAGLRWSASDRPLSPTCDRKAEVDQDYESIVGLEPEVMGQVVASGGTNPDALTMVRKARGTESHKGGKIWSEGDDSDTCLVSWLSGKADAGACAKGLVDVIPGGSSNPLAACATLPPVP
ncbi:MAG TPA: hypothetical protein VF765_14940 [Polyangiaceae bacterium]